MTREQKIEIMMGCISVYAVTIPGYLEEDYQRAINLAFQKIERAEKDEPQAGATVRDSEN